MVEATHTLREGLCILCGNGYSTFQWHCIARFLVEVPDKMTCLDCGNFDVFKQILATKYVPAVKQKLNLMLNMKNP
jgi:hypothetical protein